MYLHFHFLMTFNNTLSWLNTVSMDTQCCFFNAARVGMAGSVPGNCQKCSLIINEGKLPPVIIFMKLLSFGEWQSVLSYAFGRISSLTHSWRKFSWLFLTSLHQMNNDVTDPDDLFRASCSDFLLWLWTTAVLLFGIFNAASHLKGFLCMLQYSTWKNSACVGHNRSAAQEKKKVVVNFC